MSEHWPPKNRPMEYVIRFDDGTYLAIDETTGYGFCVNSLREAAIYSYEQLKNSRLYLWKYLGTKSPYTMPGLDKPYKVCVLMDEICGLSKYIEEGWPE